MQDVATALQVGTRLAAALLLAAWMGTTAQAARVLTDAESASRAPAWHPDGQRIAFESDRDGRWIIQVLTLATGEIDALIEIEGDARFPAWSADGQQLAYVCGDAGDTNLCISRVDGRGDTRVIDVDGEVLWPSWSADGREIAFTRKQGDALDLQIVAIAETGAPPALTLTDARWPRFSPDGQRIAFFSRRDTGGADDELYVLDRRTKAIDRLTQRPGHDFCPAWSPSGDSLVVVSVDDDGSRALRILDEQGQELARLAQGYHRVTEPAWSPDGQAIVYAAVEAEGEAYRLYLEPVAPLAAADAPGR